VIQGSFIFAKAKHGPAIAQGCLDHLTNYLNFIFSSKKT
jgi:hypothetical protein